MVLYLHPWIPPLKTNVMHCLKYSINLEINETRSSWLNCALRDDDAVYLVSIGHYEALDVVSDSVHKACPLC